MKLLGFGLESTALKTLSVAASFEPQSEEHSCENLVFSSKKKATDTFRLESFCKRGPSAKTDSSPHVCFRVDWLCCTGTHVPNFDPFCFQFGTVAVFQNLAMCLYELDQCELEQSKPNFRQGGSAGYMSISQALQHVPS